MDEIPGYINKMEKAINFEKEKTFPKNTINESIEIKNILSEISLAIRSEKDIERLGKDVAILIDSLVSNCEKGDQMATLGTVRQLRDKARYFKYYISKKEKEE